MFDKKVYMKDYREVNRDRIRQQNHDWYQQNRDIRNKQKLRDEQNHPDRRYARLIAFRKVPLDDKCLLCGTTENLHRHHFDYSKPLEVITLCASCHLGRKFGDQPLP